MDPIKIQKANLKDAEYIAYLGQITFTETFGHYFKNKKDLLDYYERTFTISKIQNSLKKGNNVFWLAYYNKTPVGYAKIKIRSKSEFLNSDYSSQLQKIYILKDFQSKKIGQKMQQEIIKEAIYNGSESIWLSVLNSNKKAIEFYEKQSFSKIGEHDFDIGQERFHFFVMNKSLKRKNESITE